MAEATRGRVESIHVAADDGGPLRRLDAATLVPGRGIEGDRYFARRSLGPHQEVTLVEAEEIERFAAERGIPVEPHDTRRNIVTRGVRLNDLVGLDFAVGSVGLRGIERCEPCSTLAAVVRARPEGKSTPAKAIVAELMGRAGLRAQIVEGGIVRVGDPVVPPTKR